MSNLVKRALVILFDGGLPAAALWLSLYLRFDGEITPYYLDSYRHLAGYYLLINMALVWLFKIQKRLWRYANFADFLLLVYYSFSSSLTLVIIDYFSRYWSFPRSVSLLTFIIGTTGLIGIKKFPSLVGKLSNGKTKRSETNAIIIGAGDTGAFVCNELNKSALPVNIVGFIDEDPAKQNMKLQGIPVLGTSLDLSEIVKRHSINTVYLAIPSAGLQEKIRMVKTLQKFNVNVIIVPGITELLNGKVEFRPSREIQVEDLLGREPVRMDLETIACYLKGKKVMVTGAGGSIGSELCRQISHFAPASLIMLDHSENNLYDIEYELSDVNVEKQVVVADIKDITRLRDVFSRYRPEVVFHAAAHKHVPMMEDNPTEAIKNNVLGTYNVAKTAHDYTVERFILISSDKAVNPQNIMGATKRVAEMIINYMNILGETKFASVRFGNVLGSKGSVIPLFKKQIAKGGPITVTHPDMERYFMTIPEAVQLVIQAGSLAKGGETFVLDMGRPVKILELARSMIELSGYAPDEIEIKYIGLRPGEKLYEELFTVHEVKKTTLHERIFVVQPDGFDLGRLIDKLTQLQKGQFPRTKEEVVSWLKDLIVSFNHELVEQKKVV